MYLYVCICIYIHIYICICFFNIITSQVVLVVKSPPANAGDMRKGFDPWVRKIPW